MVAEEIAEENKEKQLSTLKQNQKEENNRSVQMDKTVEKPKSHTSPTHTREQVAKLSGVGTGTVARYDAVMKSGDDWEFPFIRYNRHYAISGWKYCNI